MKINSKRNNIKFKADLDKPRKNLYLKLKELKVLVINKNKFEINHELLNNKEILQIFIKPTNIQHLYIIKWKRPNDYKRAIFSCFSIVSYYDDDQIFPLYSFGIPPINNNKVSHCFKIMKDLII